MVKEGLFVNCTLFMTIILQVRTGFKMFAEHWVVRGTVVGNHWSSGSQIRISFVSWITNPDFRSFVLSCGPQIQPI